MAQGNFGYTTWTFWPPATEDYLIHGIEQVWLGQISTADYLAKMRNCSQRRWLRAEPDSWARHDLDLLFRSGGRGRHRPVSAFLMIVSALKTSAEIVANPLALPRALQWANFSRAWTDAQLGRSLLNSAETTGLAVVLICSTSSMAAYALARQIGRGWRWISAYLLGTTTLPIQLYLFPLYFGFAHFGLIDNVFALPSSTPRSSAHSLSFCSALTFWPSPGKSRKPRLWTAPIAGRSSAKSRSRWSLPAF